MLHKSSRLPLQTQGGGGGGVGLLSREKFKKTDEAKIEKKPLRVPYLLDAKHAGGEFSDECTLILAEGDFAQVLEVFGMDFVRQNNYQNYYGAFPLRSKMLNVSEACQKKILKNAQIQHIIKILGLEEGKEYDNANSLRYGHLLIMTNQNLDGFYTKGLLINLFHCFWPSVLKIPSFIREFIIPIAKATHSDGHVLFFYNMPQYESWNKSLGGEKNWTIKYHEELAYCTSVEEAKEYFQSLETHQKDFTWVDERDGDAIEMAFSEKKIEARKAWLWQYKPGNYIDRKGKLIKYSDFVNKELILFFWADLQRSIPSMVDGLKLGQRKILFCAFKCNLVTMSSIDQFSFYVTWHFGYHPGVHAKAIVGMAQDFVGTNNINLFSQGGQFGTRIQVCPCYTPVIPLVLVNGSEGCGTGGSSTFVPNYNPRDICANVKRLLRGEPMVPIHPWYKGFKGTIEETTTKESGTSYTVSGKMDKIDKTTLWITELPIRTWTRDYRGVLDAASEVIGTHEPLIKDYYLNVHPFDVDFKIIMSKENLRMAEKEGRLMKELSLTTTMRTNKMFLFDQNGVIKKYDNPEQILLEFFQLRFDLYEKRREMLLKDIALKISKLRNTKRYISCVLNGDIDLISVAKNSATVLRNEGFDAFPKNERCSHASDNPYEYLRSVSFLNFNEEKVMELDSQIKELVLQQQELRDSTPKTLWMKDLDALEKELDELGFTALIHEETLNGKVVNEAAPDSSSMEMAMKEAGKLPSPSKMAAAQKQPSTTLTDI